MPEKPNFGEIFDNLDDYLLTAPIKLKEGIKNSVNEPIDPAVLSEKMAYNPKDFFWGKIDENILPVVPYEVDQEDEMNPKMIPQNRGG
mmetsp:Transcript_26042/g.22937  ORF Transcript_26042/g.22937 Transcript_26042/m.22937 type:complete len:88 (+) Transcript_26042:351-614(+)